MPSEGGGPGRLDGFRVGNWLAEPALCRLSRGDTLIRLRPQLMDMLLCLARRAGRVVPRGEIFQEVWPNQYVAQSGLARCVAELRQALQDDAQEPSYIETIPKRGYRLIAPVTFLEEPVCQASDTADLRPAALPVRPAREEQAPVIGAISKRRATAPASTRRFGLRLFAAVAVGGAVAGAILLFDLGSGPPALTEPDRLLLCFENRTGEAVFDGTLQLALAVYLEQSPFLRVVSEDRVRETLRSMGQDAHTPLSRALALEVCKRDGAKAVLASSIDSLGGRYVLGLEAVACADGDALAREQSEAGTKDEVLESLGQMVRRMRQRLEQSLASDVLAPWSGADPDLRIAALTGPMS